MKPFLIFVVCFGFFTTVIAEDVCLTAECKAVSDDLLHHSINESVAPCESFFDYVCGKWAASHPQPVGSESGLNYFVLRKKLIAEEIDEAFLHALNSSNVAIRSVAQIYSDCLDNGTIEKRGMTPLIENISKILREWPMLQKKTPEKNTTKISHWQDLFVNIYSQTGISPVFELDTYINFTQKKYFPDIQLGTISNDPLRIFFEKYHREYRAYLHKSATTFFAIPDNDRLKTDIEAVLHLEDKLNTAYDHSQNLEKVTFYGSFADLSIALNGKVDWRSIVNQIMGKLSLTKVPLLTPSDHVHVHNLPFLVEAATIFETTPISVVQNYFGLMIAFKLGHWTTDAFAREILEYAGHVYNPAERKTACNKLPKHWPIVDSRIYIDTHFSGQKKAEAEMLVKSLRIAFDKDLANHTEWLDEKTRKAAREKLKAIKQTVGYEDLIVSDKTLTTIYPHLNNQTIVKGKFLESVMAFGVDVRRSKMAILLRPTDIFSNPESKIQDPTIVNGIYYLFTNSLEISAGILSPPFFNDQRPFSMNYGAIGAIIGHELTHAFDNHGAQYDKDGKRKNWWTAETHAKFIEKSKCFVDQYGALKEPLSGVTLNGKLTLGENIADNGGIRRAYDAYLEHQKAIGKASQVLPSLNLTASQLFFVAYAHSLCENVTPKEAKKAIEYNDHSPARFRVDTVLGNTAAFAEAFKCPIGSKMNPVKKCALW